MLKWPCPYAEKSCLAKVFFYMVQHKADGSVADHGAKINLCYGLLRHTHRQTHTHIPCMHKHMHMCTCIYTPINTEGRISVMTF